MALRLIFAVPEAARRRWLGVVPVPVAGGLLGATDLPLILVFPSAHALTRM